MPVLGTANRGDGGRGGMGVQDLCQMITQSLTNGHIGTLVLTKGQTGFDAPTSSQQAGRELFDKI